MPGSPFYSGLFEGFNTRRQKEYDTNLAAEAKAREAEAEIYKTLLLHSTDQKIQALAMAGLGESARPSSRMKGLRGFMGEVQAGEMYPQILAAMEEQVPDTQAAPPATPQSAALPSTTPVHGGEMGAAAPTFQAPMPQAPEDITAALGMGAPESSFGAPAGPAPGAPQAGMVGQPPPEHPTHRRGTGIPTAEEVAEMQARVATQTKIKVATEELTRAGATPDEIQRTIMGMLGAPQNNRMFAAPTFAVIDPQTNEPTPVSFDYSTGKYAFTDGTPVPRGAKFVRMAGGASGSLTSTAKDSPEMRQWLLQNGADPKDIANGSPTGYWRYQQRLDGSMMVGPGEWSPQSSTIGTVQAYDANGNPTVYTVPRVGGPPGLPNVIGGAITGQPTEEQSNAQALLAEIEKIVTSIETPEFLGAPRTQVSPQQRDQIARQRAAAAGLPYTTYYEVQQASRRQRRPSPTPTTPKPAGVPGGGGSALSQADQVRQRALEIMKQKGGAAPPPVPPPPPAPAPAPERIRGPR